MPSKTTSKTSRINVKKLKGNPKELDAKQLKKVKGGIELQSDSSTLRKGSGLQHNETLVSDNC